VRHDVALLSIPVRHLEAPTPLNPPGAKGAGEGGITIEDARAPFGARAERSPARRLTSTR